MEADYEAARLLTLKAAWMADNGKPNSLEASMAKAKAGRACVDVTLGCVELCGGVGYGENELLEKWARDAKILDIFEGTQQIQLLIVARQLLGKSSSELRRRGCPSPRLAAGRRSVPWTSGCSSPASAAGGALGLLPYRADCSSRELHRGSDGAVAGLAAGDRRHRRRRASGATGTSAN